MYDDVYMTYAFMEFLDKPLQLFVWVATMGPKF